MLEVDSDNVDALCDRAELYVSQQMYEEAIKDYQKAKDVENHPQKVLSQHFTCTHNYELSICADVYGVFKFM